MITKSVVNATSASNEHSDPDYKQYLERLQASFEQQVVGEPLFTTDATDLFDAYLAAISEEQRQHFTCHACRDFVRQFGGLVTIDAAGRTTPLFWWIHNGAPGELVNATEAIARLVRRAKVTGVFLSSECVWGRPVTGNWCHLAVTPPAQLVYQATALKNAHQAAAEKLKDFGQVMRALTEFSQPALNVAMTLLESDQLYRSEKLLGAVQWLRDLKAAREKARGAARANLVWRAVATAPAGFCHPRSGMAGTLLEDLAAGLSFDDVAKRFAAKMHPLAYQRLQAAPTAGNIAQGEKIIEQLGLTTALQRRYARLDEVETLWRPAPIPADAFREGGVFRHLMAKGAVTEPIAPLAPAVTMTWVKFCDTVLPNARRIEYRVGTENQQFMALLTAADPEAAPLLQWDSPDRRNPVSWYFWNGGSPPAQWGLKGRRFHPVTAVALFPPMWGENPEKFAHHGKGVTFFLDGMRETKNGGLALFPETLRFELREVRATIEAFSRQGELTGMAEGDACGIGFSGSKSWDAHLRVWTDTGVTDYRLDRWD